MRKNNFLGPVSIIFMAIFAVTCLLFFLGGTGGVLHAVRTCALFVISIYAISCNRVIAVEQQSLTPVTRKRLHDNSMDTFFYRVAIVAIGIIIAAFAFVYAVDGSIITNRLPQKTDTVKTSKIMGYNSMISFPLKTT